MKDLLNVFYCSPAENYNKDKGFRHSYIVQAENHLEAAEKCVHKISWHKGEEYWDKKDREIYIKCKQTEVVKKFSITTTITHNAIEIQN